MDKGGGADNAMGIFFLLHDIIIKCQNVDKGREEGGSADGDILFYLVF